MSLARRSGTHGSRTSILAWIVIATVFALGLTAVPVTAHESRNHGTIKVHDEMTAQPERRNEPHVSCDFWVQGFEMSDDSGILVFYAWAPTGEGVVLEHAWEGTEAEKKGYDFLAGPFNLTEGHYRVEAFLASGHPGNEDHFSKAKMFWVDPCPTPPEPLPCPPSLLAAMTDDGAIELTWDPAEGSDGTNIYRAINSGDFEFITTVGSDVSSFRDEDVEIGTTYTYTVTGLFGNRESTLCGEVEITMIPDFPSVLALSAAAALGIGGYVFATRRKK